MTEADTPILNRIFERLGGIDAKLQSGKESHEEFKLSLHGIHAELSVVNERLNHVEKLAARVPVIEPTVWELEGRRIEAQAVNKFFGGVMTKGRAAVGVVGGSIGAALTTFVTWVWHLVGSPPPHP